LRRIVSRAASRYQSRRVKAAFITLALRFCAVD
jgi:hypothetical protein